MNIDRGIRARQSLPYPSGVKLAELAEEIFSSESLETSHHLDKIKIKFPPVQSFPNVITLRVRLQEVPIQNMSCQMQVTVENTINEAAPYYSTKNIASEDSTMAKFGQNEAVELYFTGQGQWDDKPFQGTSYNNFQLVLPTTQLLFRKNFKTQKGFLSLKHSRNAQGMWEIHLPQKAPLPSCTPLFGYGGFYRKGVAVELIMPIFATLAFQNHISRPDLYSLEYLQKLNIDPPRGGMKGNDYWYFEDNLSEEEQISLATSLKSGALTVVLQHQNNQTKKVYKSYSFDQTNIRNGEIDIILMPQSN